MRFDRFGFLLLFLLHRVRSSNPRSFGDVPNELQDLFGGVAPGRFQLTFVGGADHLALRIKKNGYWNTPGQADPQVLCHVPVLVELTHIDIHELKQAPGVVFDFLVVRQVVPSNPASSVRGPKYVIKRGKTPVLTAQEARKLLDSIDTSKIAGVRDRAIIGVMIFTFARVGAVVGMNVEDYYQNGRRSRLRLHEKGGKHHVVPAHHLVERFLDEYIEASGRRQPSQCLFPAAGGRGRLLSERRLTRNDALRMIKRRARKAGIGTNIGAHSFRATGITIFRSHGGTLERAQQIAAHADPKTTRLYDRSEDPLTLDEIERISL